MKKHPRVCGEDFSHRRMSRYQSETPPRMRGRPFTAAFFDAYQGNTPAYAGKTSSQNR